MSKVESKGILQSSREEEGPGIAQGSRKVPPHGSGENLPGSLGQQLVNAELTVGDSNPRLGLQLS